MQQMDIEIITELTEILRADNKSEKHVGYHILPDRLEKMLGESGEETKHVFYENERLEYMTKYVDFTKKSVLDIGCNVGYFLFSFLDLKASSVCGYEGKKSCGRFVNKAIELLNETDKFKLHNEYYDFSGINSNYDVTLLLNVLHHVGDDYDNSQSINDAKLKIIKQLNSMAKNTRILIFQLGFNWMGNTNHCLFDHGTKAEMIDYISEGTASEWDIMAIGIAEKENNKIKYNDLNKENIVRDDTLGEFLNRPLFIMKSKSF